MLINNKAVKVVTILFLPFYLLIVIIQNVTKPNRFYTPQPASEREASLETTAETTLANTPKLSIPKATIEPMPSSPLITQNETNVIPCEDQVLQYCRNRRIQYIQIYHISKAGGTTLRRTLHKVLNLKTPDTSSKSPWPEAWSREDFGVWRSEKENQCDIRYKRDPNSDLKQQVFILGLVRNPFSYYRSYHIMVTSEKFNEPCKVYLRTNGKEGDYEKCFCEMKVAYETHKSHLYISSENNRSSFDEFVRFLMSPETKHCSVNMQDRHDNTMNMKDDKYAYDYVIKQEYFWEDVYKALQVFDCCIYPEPIVRWDVLKRFMLSASGRHQTRSQFLKEEKVFPDFCFYDEGLRRKVEMHDGNMMRLHGYTWESSVGDGRLEDCLGLQ